MAQNQNLNNLAKIPHPEIKKHIQTGDILFYSGEDEVSKLIRLATKSIWSHVGILIKIEEFERVLLLESVESMGVRLIPLSKYIKNIEEDEEEEEFYARLVIARHQLLKNKNIKDFVNFGISQVNRPYDREEIQRIMQRISAGEGKQHRDKAYMCSELVYECFLKVDIDIPYNHLGFISPHDIWTNNDIEAILEIDHL